MRSFYQSLLALWGHLGANQRVSLAIAAMVVVAGLAALVSWSRRPDYQLLYGRLGEKDASAVISQLQASGIPHRIEGGAVYVPVEQVHRLRMDLAGKGIPSGDGIGFEIFDKGNFGVSDFVQRTNYARALQGELSRTISQLEGVRSARVLIVQPENRLLLVDQSIKPSASVFIELGGGRISADQVNAIRHLVSNSVQGLLPDAVAVVDNRGRVLSEELKSDPLLTTASSQIRYRQSVEDYFARKVESMLSAAVGAGNAIVRVSAEVDTDATTIAEEKFDPEGQVVRSQTNTEDNSASAEGRTGGVAGTAANVPDAAAAGAATAGGAAAPQTRTEQTRKNRTTSYEINSTRTSITRTPGTIRSITAAVFLNQRPSADPANPQPQPRTPAELTTLRQLVVNALGVKLGAGVTAENVVALQEVAFPAEPLAIQAEQLRQQNKWQPYADTALRFLPLLAAAALVLFFLRRLGREKPEAVPVELLRELPSPDGRSVGSNPGSITPELINELIRQKPTNVGTALRDWVAINKQS
ncbi:MAG: flagellar M-ring protein FliF [Opitutaceae bacterium]|nr:flagellar M-ring protein FliF [Opitutaceae bacterium]